MNPTYFDPLPEILYRAAKGDPTEPSNRESRVYAEGTGGICMAYDLETAKAEVDNDPSFKIYEFIPKASIRNLNLKRYCEGEKIDPEQVYAGVRSLDKLAHSFYGKGIQAMNLKVIQKYGCVPEGETYLQQLDKKLKEEGD